MQTTHKTSAQIFKEAIDWFFGHNPANPFWFLFVLCLRKKHLLFIEENYPSDSVNNLTPFNTSDYWRDTTRVKFQEGVRWKSVVGLIEDDQRLVGIYKEFENDAQIRRISQRERSRNLFSRYQWEDSFLIETVQMLLSIDDEWLNHHFLDCFNIALRRIYANERFDLYSQPTEITELVGRIFHKIGQGVKRVYNPFAGSGSYALFTGDAIYVGEEINRIIAAVANLRIFAADVNGEVLVEDSINPSDHNADIIVSTPPFMLPISDSYLEERFDGRNDASTLLMRKCAMSGIKGIIVTPMGTSFRNDYSRGVRELLIERDCLDMVIELPTNIFEGTAVATAIYVINPSHCHKGAVRIINAAERFTFNKTKNTLNVDEILSIIDSDNQDSILIDFNTLARNDFSLLFNRYFQPVFDLPEGTNLMHIGELGGIFAHRTPRHITRGKFATFLKLSNPNKLKIFTPSDFEEQPLPPSSICLDQDCIIVSGARGLRANCIQPQGELLYVPASYFCFLPNENVILPQYLVLQLRSEMVQKQVGDRSLASVRRDEFLNLRIIVPPIEEQRKTIDEYQASLISDLGVQVNDLRTQRFNEYERNMHLRKHALKQVMNEVLPAARRIANFITSQQGNFSKKSIIAERSQSTLESYVVKLFSNVEKVNSLISALTEETRFNEPQIIEIDTFIANYKRSKLADNYELTYLGHNELLDDVASDISEGPLIAVTDQGDPVFVLPGPVTVYIAPDSLTTVLDNIIANAVKHGFTNPERKDYAIRIEFRNAVVDDRDMVEFIVANNGEKLPAGMSADRMFTWGVGSGTGLGSWQTKNIIEHFGGSIEFIQYEDKADGFNIEYRFTIPMRNE